MIKITSWILAIVAAIIMLQTLYFKFTGAPESVALFTKLGIEPYGRILTGLGELLASSLLIIPITRKYGAFLTLLLMLGAISSHLVIIGIESASDGGQLFFLAITVFICALGLLLLPLFQKRIH